MGLRKLPGESWRSWRFRLGMNAYPMYWGTGGRIRYIAGDFREVRLSLGLNPFTYNYVGTIFGGSMFAAADPFLMLMFFHILGKEYVVWDKAARIRFRRPGRSRLSMRIVIDDELLARVRKTVAEQGVWTEWLPIDWLDAEGSVVAAQEREVYVASKAHYRARKAGMNKGGKGEMNEGVKG